MPASPYDSQILATDQAIRTFAAEIRSQIDASRLNAADFGIPYFTGAIVNGKERWGVVLDFGPLPNDTTKVIIIPTAVTDVWAATGERWIDTANSFCYDPVAEVTLPLPHSSSLDLNGNPNVTSDEISIHIANSEVLITTESDRTAFNAVVTLKYLKEPPV